MQLHRAKQQKINVHPSPNWTRWRLGQITTITDCPQIELTLLRDKNVSIFMEIRYKPDRGLHWPHRKTLAGHTLVDFFFHKFFILKNWFGSTFDDKIWRSTMEKKSQIKCMWFSFWKLYSFHNLMLKENYILKYFQRTFIKSPNILRIFLRMFILGIVGKSTSVRPTLDVIFSYEQIPPLPRTLHYSTLFLHFIFHS